MAVRSEPRVPGGRLADLAVDLEDDWTYIEVKTRNLRAKKRDLCIEKNILSEMLRLLAHSTRQLPRHEPAMAVLSTSASANKQLALRRITTARAFGDRFFQDNPNNIIGVIIIAPFRRRRSRTGWGYASAIIQNPKWRESSEDIAKLAAIQL